MVLAQPTSSLSALRADFRFSRRETDLLKEELLANVLLAAAASKSDAVPRSVQVFKRNKQWFESTPPNLPAYFFKQSFLVMPSTLWYLVDLCWPHKEHQVTIMRATTSVKERVGTSLYKLCSIIEGTAIAHLFSQGRSTVNELYKEFCVVFVSALEPEWVKMVSAAELVEHVRKFEATLGFLYAIGTFDRCHFPVSPPQVDAIEYINYKGW